MKKLQVIIVLLVLISISSCGNMSDNESKQLIEHRNPNFGNDGNTNGDEGEGGNSGGGTGSSDDKPGS